MFQFTFLGGTKEAQWHIQFGKLPCLPRPKWGTLAAALSWPDLETYHLHGRICQTLSFSITSNSHVSLPITRSAWNCQRHSYASDWKRLEDFDGDSSSISSHHRPYDWIGPFQHPCLPDQRTEAESGDTTKHHSLYVGMLCYYSRYNPVFLYFADRLSSGLPLR